MICEARALRLDAQVDHARVLEPDAARADRVERLEQEDGGLLEAAGHDDAVGAGDDAAGAAEVGGERFSQCRLAAWVAAFEGGGGGVPQGAAEGAGPGGAGEGGGVAQADAEVVPVG